MAASDSTDLIFFASFSSIRAYKLERGVDYEQARLNHPKRTKDFEVLRPRLCELDHVLSGDPEFLLGCHFLGGEINAMECGYTDLEGEVIEVLVAVTDGGYVHVWWVGDEILTRPPLVYQNGKSTWSIALSDKHNILAVGANSHEVSLISLETGQMIRRLVGHEHNIPSVGFSPCGGFLISGSIDESCIVWDVQTGEAVSKGSLLEAHWGWTVGLLDTDCIEIFLQEHAKISRALRNHREFCNLAEIESDDLPSSPSLISASPLFGTDISDYDYSSDEYGQDCVFDEEDIAIWNGDVNVEELFRATDLLMDQEMTGGAHHLLHFGGEDTTPTVSAGHGLTTWIVDAPRPGLIQEEYTPRVFNRLLPAVEEQARVLLPGTLETIFPSSKSISFCMTQDGLYLFDASSGTLLFHVDRVVERAFGEPHYEWGSLARERFIYSRWIPELSCLLAANQCGCLVLAHLSRVLKDTSLDADEPSMLRISFLGFPYPEFVHGSLKGVTLRGVGRGLRMFYEVFVLHVGGVMRVFRIRRTVNDLLCMQL